MRTDNLKSKLYFLYLFLLPGQPSLAALECPPSRYLVRSHPRAAYYRADGTFVRATKVSEFCREKNATFLEWVPRMKNGLPQDWENKSEKATRWTEEQRERVLEAIDELPAVLQKMPLIGIHRMSKSEFYPNPASYSNEHSVLAIYDTAFGIDQNLARVIAHELGHAAYLNLAPSDRINYRNAVGWEKIGLTHGSTALNWKERAGGFVAEDGRQGPMEDFANNLEFYLFEPNVLKEKTPKAFDWMKRYFGDSFKLRRGSK